VAGSKRRTNRPVEKPRVGQPVEKPRIGRPVERRNKLGEWVDAHGWTRHQLAEALGIAFGTATRLCSGARRPSLEMAIQIEDLTDGAVSVRSWLAVPAHTKD
jgi:DNA-binding XRE family transcriptional regulator